jgi:hypothetical protein
MTSKPMMTNSSLRSAEGPKAYDRIASKIRPAITQAIKRVVCATVIMAYSIGPNLPQPRASLPGLVDF